MPDEQQIAELARALAEAQAMAEQNPAAFWFVEAPRHPVTGKRLWACARPKQMEFHKSPSWSRWVIAGNRWGKSEVCVRDTAAFLLACHPFRKTPPRELAGRCYALTYGKIDEILIPKFRHTLGQWFVGYNRQDHIMRVRDPRLPSRIHCVYMCTYDQALSIAEGGEYDFVQWDEPPPKPLYEANQLRIIDRGGFEVAALTPLAKGIQWDVSWIHHDIVLGGAENGCAVWHGNTEENRENLDEEAFDRTFGKMSDAEKLTRMSGQFEFLQGLVYKDPAFSEEFHVCEPFDVVERVARRLGGVYRGLDHGIGNPTAVSWWYIEGHGEDTKCYKFREYLQDGLSVERNCANIRRLDADLPKGVFHADPSIWNRDPVTGLALAQEYIKHGVTVTQGDNEFDRGTAIVQNLMRVPRRDGATWRDDPEIGTPRFMVCRNCQETIAAYQRYVWARQVSARTDDIVAKPKPEERFKHLPDTDRYVLASHPQGLPDEVPPLPDLDKKTGVPRRIAVRPVAETQTFEQREAALLGVVE